MPKHKLVSVRVPDSLYLIPEKVLSEFLEYELKLLVYQLMQRSSFDTIADYFSFFNGDLDGKT